MDRSPRVTEILSWYGADSPGTLANLARMLEHGKLGGTGKMLILPADQGFEHGPARSFGPNPPAYDPLYHFELALAAGCNAYAAPLGFLEAGARDYAGRIPLILKLNDHDLLADEDDPEQAITGSVADALRLGACAVGFTIYPGSAHRNAMYGQIRAIAEEAKSVGLAVVIWSYARGSALSKAGETAIDVIGYAAQIAAQARVARAPEAGLDLAAHAAAVRGLDRLALQTPRVERWVEIDQGERGIRQSMRDREVVAVDDAVAQVQSPESGVRSPRFTGVQCDLRACTVILLVTADA